MPAITNMVARYSGLVTFTDNTKESFHCQMENDTMWSIDASGSHSAQEKICWHLDSNGYVYWGNQMITWINLPFITNAYLDTDLVVVSKTINDMVIRGEITFSLDNGGSYPVSFSWDRKGEHNFVAPDGPGITNLSEYLTKISTMLGQILDTTTLL